MNKPINPTSSRKCLEEGCINQAQAGIFLCSAHKEILDFNFNQMYPEVEAQSKPESNLCIADKYPKYYKSVKELEAVDVYQVHRLFDIQDPSGAIQHASKKLLLSGVRTGGKTQFDDIREARDTLNRWLELNNP